MDTIVACYAYYSSGVVNGTCGSVNNTNVDYGSLNTSSANLCSAGTVANWNSPPTIYDAYWWTCNGSGGGTNSDWCIAHVKVNGTCGSQSSPSSGGVTSGSLNSSSANLCSIGTVGNFQVFNSGDGDAYWWTCDGSYGGTSPWCSIHIKVNGVLGTANGHNYAATDTTWGSYTQCAPGTSSNTSFPPQGGSTNWYCAGLWTGTNSGTGTATRSLPVTNGVCGTANTHGYTSTSEIDTAAERCAAGTFTSFYDNGDSWVWGCNGLNGGTNAPCYSYKVACGAYHNTTRRDQPSSSLCSYGSNTTLNLSSNIWYWNCTNNPGVNASCYTYKTTCGSSNGGSFTSAPSTNLCTYGSASGVTTNPTTYTWTCTGNDSLAVSCSATRLLPENGVCGTANGHNYTSSDTTWGSYTQCSVGSPSTTSFPAIDSSTTWTCSGINGGSASSTCTASRTIINGACGTANRTFTEAETSWGVYTFCSLGTASPASPVFPLVGASTTWTCLGINGGTNSGTCTANRSQNGVCGTVHNTTTSTEPSTNLCSVGTATARTLTDNVWYWLCTNSPGESTACYTYKTVCGSSNGGSFQTAPTTNLCIYGSASNVTAGETTYTWTCTGNDTTPVSCSATKVTGSCMSCGGLTCTETTDGIYTIHKYTGVGTCDWATPEGIVSAEYLIVAGGGGGGGVIGGGGGGGGFLNGNVSNLSGTYSITVGAGGGGGYSWNSSIQRGYNGGNSLAFGLTAIGGGGGGAHGGNDTRTTGAVGGSAGGSGNTLTVTAGTTGQGNTGGGGDANNGGGGGGSGGAGGTRIVSSSGGSGGLGVASSITGTSLYYAAAGGGGTRSGYGVGGTGGSGIGGNGGTTDLTKTATDGAPNTGSGGGGSGHNGSSTGTVQSGGNGSSGTVIIRFTNQGVCGSADGTSLSVAPTTNLCAGGSASAVSGTGPWTWTCTGGGVTDNCSASFTSCISCGGLTCTETTDGAYTINKYTGPGTCTWTPPSGVAQVEYLVVAGGGGGGVSDRAGGGGGAGGLLTSTGYSVSGAQTVTVGAGGGNSINGGNSVFGTITAIGGGRGGNSAGAVGGSGGGGSHNGNALGGAGTSGQGNAGGRGYDSGVVGQPFTGGGGGGKSAVGAGGNTTSGGAGGAGFQSSITGTALYYAGGGGGAGQNRPGGAGGSGIGGAGSTGAGGVAIANTGSGGGGGGSGAAGGAGSAGVVVIKYLKPVPVNGVCGTSNGGTFISVPTTNLCNTGGASTVSVVGSSWTWTCSGTAGGNTVSCSATVLSSCGTSNGGTFISAPTTNLCDVLATSSAVTTNETTFDWNCSIGGSSPAWYNVSWLKRKPITITSSATLTDYQVKVVVAYDSDMQADFDDIRFMSSDGTTLLNYWLESKTNSTTATFWVKVPTLANGSNTIYMYYGNASVSTTSSGANTFIHFDDFEGSTTATGGSIYSSVVYAGSQSYGKTDGQTATFAFSSTLTGEVNLSMWMYLTARGFSTSRNIYFYSTTDQYFQLHHRDSDWSRNGNYTSFPIHNSSGTYAFTPSMATNTWYRTELKLNFTTKQASLYVYNTSNTLVISRTGQAINNDNINRIIHYAQADSNTSSPIYYDNLIARKTTATEPTSALGTEEEMSIGVVSNCSATKSAYSGPEATSLQSPTQINSDESCWYCTHYYTNESDATTLTTGRNGQVDFKFTYSDSDPTASLTHYMFSIGTSTLQSSALYTTADWLPASGTTVTYNGISVKSTPSYSLGQIGYNATYHWWFKVKNSNSIESDWIEGTAFTTASKHWPTVRIVSDKTAVTIGSDIQYCATTNTLNRGTDTSNCFNVCWIGSGDVAILTSGDWKCSVCYDSGNNPVLCGPGNSNTFTWAMPIGSTFQSSTNVSSANPVLRYTLPGDSLKPKLKITGSDCSGEGEGTTSNLPVPKWIEVGP